MDLIKYRVTFESGKVVNMISLHTGHLRNGIVIYATNHNTMAFIPAGDREEKIAGICVANDAWDQ